MTTTLAMLILSCAAISPKGARAEKRELPLDLLVEYAVPLAEQKLPLRDSEFMFSELRSLRDGAVFPTNNVFKAINHNALLAEHKNVPGCSPDPKSEATERCIVAVHENPPIRFGDRPAASGCPEPSYGGGLSKLRSHLGAEAVIRDTPAGEGVLIAVVDKPFNARYVERGTRAKLDSDYSYSADGAVAGQGSHLSHGTMAAFLATVLAPNATIASISSGGFIDERLATFVNGMDHLTKVHLEKRRYRHIVVNNSWSVADSTLPGATGTCLGTFPRRPLRPIAIDQPCHIVNRVLTKITAPPYEFDVLFAAGNQGSCEPTDTGSIRGPGLHSAVLTVAAVDHTKRRLRDSGQGTVSNGKPNVTARTHYTSSRPGMMDTQTSAATAVVSGLVATLRSCMTPSTAGTTASRPLTPFTAITTAADTGAIPASGISSVAPRTRGADPEFGAGVIDPLNTIQTACPRP